MSVCAGAAQMQDNAEPMQVDIYYEENDNVRLAPGGTVENSTLDLESYAASYKGLAKLHRLMHIASCCSSLRLEALRTALTSVMSSFNTAMYQKIHKKLQEAVNSQTQLPDAVAGVVYSVPALDTQWIETTSKQAALRLEKLDNDLKNYKSNSIKESIRRGHDDLGDHYLECGDLNNALKCYSRARDYCTSSKHCVNMCMNVIKVSIYLSNWSHVLSYINKAETAPYIAEQGKDGNLSITTKLKVAAGLADMVCGRYKAAAKQFLQANLDHVDFPELLSANNVASYGALCALATFDRHELQRLVITNSSFKLFLELEPMLRDIILCFYESKYTKCLKLLDEIKSNLQLDMYLAAHVEELYDQIRSRALCQYFSPYASADMYKMAAAFNTAVVTLEDELMNLIQSGKINARIDSHSKVLYAQAIDQRSTTFGKSFENGSDAHRRTRALILRAAVVRSRIKVMGSTSTRRERPQGPEASQFPGDNPISRFIRLTGSATA